MNPIEQWAVTVAQEVAPDEIDLAPDIVSAYLAGGKERQTLFTAAEESAVGSFGAVDMISLLPTVLQLITFAWTQTQPLVSNPGWVKDSVSFVKDLLTIGDLTTRRKKVKELPVVEPYSSIKGLIFMIEKQVQTVPLKPDQRELLTYRILKAILENPVGTEAFVAQAKKA